MKRLIFLLALSLTVTFTNCSTETPITQSEVVKSQKVKLSQFKGTHQSIADLAYEYSNDAIGRAPGDTQVCSSGEYSIVKDRYGNHSLHSTENGTSLHLFEIESNEVGHWCSSLAKLTKKIDYNKIGERMNGEIAELGKIVIESSSKGATTSSRDGFNIICTGSTPADNLGYGGSEHTVWQDRYGTYYFTLKSGGSVQTVRMIDQDLNSAYSLC